MYAVVTSRAIAQRGLEWKRAYLYFSQFVPKSERKSWNRSQRRGFWQFRRGASLLLSCVTVLCVVNSRRNGSMQHWNRLLPRTVRELRRQFLVDWRYALKRAQQQPKYRVENFDLRVFVISLERVRERKLETIHSLELQGIPWATHTAVDGLDDLDTVAVAKYAGYKKKKRLSVTNNIGMAQLLSLKRDYDGLKNVPFPLKISLHERLQFGCYMSHVLLWQKILQLDAPFAIILEDDAVIAENFSDEFKARLERLPVNWDVLFLNGCHKKFGSIFDSGLRQSRGGLCTFAYTISSKGARHLLRRAVLNSNKPIDHILDYETLTGRLLSFHADPPLAYTSSYKMSTLAY